MENIFEKFDEVIFLSKEEDYKKPHLAYKNTEWVERIHCNDNYKLYGAIWTEWGLKYISTYDNNTKEWRML